jgi:hypothetical protein
MRPVVLYYNQKGEGKPTKPERKKKMEYFEIMDTNLTELQEWLDFEADMATHPYD